LGQRGGARLVLRVPSPLCGEGQGEVLALYSPVILRE
jgi:hypothetical protein